jgi:hypothetical protein
MSSLANRIQQDSNCGQDLQLQNPVVEHAYNAMLAYTPLYQAGCLQDGDGNYCFANAVTNKSAPTGGYIYYLPLGVQLPGGTEPTCNTCLQKTMSIFASAASNNSVPLASDYTTAAQMVDENCGPEFVQASVVHTSPGSTVTGPTTSLISLMMLFAFLWNFVVV